MNAIIGIIVAVVLAAGGGWLYLQNKKVTDAEAERDAAIVQRDMVAGERDKAIEVARTNDETISELQREKELVNQALNTLQAQKQIIIERTVVREQTIQGQASSASSRAVVAPVISSLIAGIDAERRARR